MHSRLGSKNLMIRLSCIVWFIMILPILRTRAFLSAHFPSRHRLIPVKFSRGLLKSFSTFFVPPNQYSYIIANSEDSTNPALKILQSHNSDIRIAVANVGEVIPVSNYLWTNYRNGIQLDSLVLEEQYLGNKKYADLETSQIWADSIKARMAPKPSLALNEALAHELCVALDTVQRAAYVIRSLQQILLNPASEHPISQILQSTPHSLSARKTDNTPVTVADFAVQALVIDMLSTAFPSDQFIAEEDSAMVRSDPAVCEAVLFILLAATGTEWCAERLYAVLDKGSATTESTASVPTATATTADITSSKPQRVWVLDPIDGTKGFMRGEHCCTGLGLLVDGVTQLSVLGCPNLNLLRLLQGSSYDDKDIAYIDPPIAIQSTTSGEAMPTVFHPDSGSVYYAVSKQGAFARSLSMLRGAAFEVTTSTIADSTQARLCESAEAMFGDRELTAGTAEMLGVTKEYLRIDGMCKHCVVGVGAAEATLRLPPSGYKEKVWDHVPGDHFVREAGGRVTDLNNKELDFTRVNQMNAAGGHVIGNNNNNCQELGAEVQGIVVSNGHLHDTITAAIRKIRASLGRL